MSFLIPFFLVASVLASDTNNSTILKLATSRFAGDIYKQIIKRETGNIIISPFSAEVVLGLLDIGCEGSTAQQLSKGLYLPNDKEKIKLGIKSGLIYSNSSVFNIANGLFVQENFSIKKSFQKIATEDFFAKTENVDFGKNEKAASTINKWVESKTNNTITNLIAPDDLSDDTRVVLVNAAHFLGRWSIPFFKSSTSKGDFYKSSTYVIQVDFMRNDRKSFNYYYCDTLKVHYLELLFENKEASITFALPEEKNGLPALEKHIVNICLYTVPFKSTPITVVIPKFKFENTINFENILKGLNVTKIFNSAEADLSGIAGIKGDLFVRTVVQKAFIDLNESGVEASASTAAEVITESDVQHKASFIANQPFMFFIVYQNVTIFIGRVTEPNYE